MLHEAGEYIPHINVRFIKQKGRVTATERSPYYDNMSVDVERFETLTVIYEDPQGNSHSRDVSGDLARTFQP